MVELTERRYLRGREVAERLGVSIATVYRLIQRGEFIEGTRFGGSRRWDVQAVDAWAQSKSHRMGKV